MIGTKFEQLDALRFVAVFSVLLSHWPIFHYTESVHIFSGADGVNLFFVISGFLITLGLIRAKEKEQKTQKVLLNFYARRFLRIFPIYYLLLILLWFFNHKKVVDGMPWYLSYTANFYSIKIKDWGGMGHLWSLSIEEQFYLIWPFVILFVSLRVLPFIIASTIIFSLCMKTYWALNGNDFWTLYMNPIAAIDTLGLGALLAYFYQFHREKLNIVLNNPIFISLIVLQIIAFIYFSNYTHFDNISVIIYRFSYGLFFFLIIGRVVFGIKGILGNILSFKPILYIGRISYGLYLVHIIIPGMFMGLKYPPDESLLRFLIYFAVALTISSLSWYYIEKPILKLKEKFE